MKYTLAVDKSRGGNPDIEKEPMTMLVALTQNEQYQCIITKNATEQVCDTITGTDYESVKQSGINFIEDNIGDVTIVKVNDIETLE